MATNIPAIFLFINLHISGIWTHVRYLFPMSLGGWNHNWVHLYQHGFILSVQVSFYNRWVIYNWTSHFRQWRRLQWFEGDLTAISKIKAYHLNGHWAIDWRDSFGDEGVPCCGGVWPWTNVGGGCCCCCCGVIVDVIGMCPWWTPIAMCPAFI